MNFLARFACYRVSHSLRFRQGYRVFPIISSYLIVPQLRIVTGIKMQSRERANGSDEHEERGDSGKRITRSEVGQKEKENREFYLHMNLEDKRKLYKCKKRYITLEEIVTWDFYYHKNKAKLLKKLGKKKKPLYQVNAEINRKVSIWKGDITTLEIDAIVNAANSSLLGGGGVDGAIHEAAGKKLYEECVTLHGCNTGEAKITGGYKLPAKYVIHTVGPIGEKEMLLTSAYENCLKIMMEKKLRSLALPCISTGIYGYDNEKACHVALKVVRKFLTENADSVDRVIFCLFLAKDDDLYEENMQIYFPVETVETIKLEESSGSSEEKVNTDPKEESQEVKQKETGRAGKKAKVLDKEGNSSDVEMKSEPETISEIETEGDSPEKENIKASESEGKEKKTSSDADKEKSTETIKSKTHDKDSFQSKENTKSLKVKDKEGKSKDVEMKEIKSTDKSKLKIKGHSEEKEKVKASESEGHDMELESNDKSSEDAQAFLGKTNVSKNESGDKETDGKQFGKCDPVQTSRM